MLVASRLLLSAALLGATPYAAAASTAQSADARPLRVDPAAMDYRSFAAPATGKSAGSLKPQLDGGTFHPVTVEVRSRIDAEGQVQVECDGGVTGDHAGHVHAHAANAEPQR